MSPPRAAVAPLAVAVAVLGCSTDFEEIPQERASQVVREDSAGVSIVVSTGPEWGRGEGWIVGRPELDLARSGESPMHEFFRVSDVVTMGDSMLAVAVGPEVRIFTRTGDAVATLGGRGEGPGEYSSFLSLTVHQDTLVVYDFLQRRLTLYDDTLALASVVRLEDAAYELGPVSSSAGLVAHVSRLPSEGEGLLRTETPVVLLDLAGAVQDTISWLGGRDILRIPQGDVFLVEESPFGKEGHVASHGEVVYLGDASLVEYRTYSATGALLTIVRADRGLNVSRSRLEAERSAVIGPDPSPRLRELWTTLISAIPQPMTLPAYQALEVDPLGYVWLEAFTGAALADNRRVWDVFTPDHRWLGEITLPPGFKAVEIGRDFVVGISKDEYDVETVQVLPVLGREP